MNLCISYKVVIFELVYVFQVARKRDALDRFDFIALNVFCMIWQVFLYRYPSERQLSGFGTDI